ncbi:hypothetical protein PINS_up006244 [Pythium insidiosum]|nr:hypothetical protein PINS_up006244 [Pythium insidiosum]
MPLAWTAHSLSPPHTNCNALVSILEIAHKRRHRGRARSLHLNRHSHSHTHAHTHMNMEFSKWSHQRQHAESPASSASSWVDTDSESDSEDVGQFVFFGDRSQAKHISSSRKLGVQRTAPIMIPQQASMDRRWRSSLEFNDDMTSTPYDAASPEFDSFGPYDPDDLDEDDPAFYGNLAYLRSNHVSRLHEARLGRASSQRRAVTSSVRASIADDEQIFAMEL